MSLSLNSGVEIWLTGENGRDSLGGPSLNHIGEIAVWGSCAAGCGRFLFASGKQNQSRLGFLEERVMGESVWRKVRGVLGALGLGAERSSCENKRAPHCRRIALEPLEDRRLLAVFNVNSSLDAIDANVGDGLAADAAGNTTLRAAIMEANATAASDTINLPAGTYNLTLSGFGEDAAATGDLDITQSVNILGAGAETTVIDASAIEDRIFDLFNSATVEIRDLTLTGGKASDNGVYSGQEDDGGAMRTGFYNRVSIAGCIFQGNSAPEASGTSSYGSGGAIYSLARSLVIENTQFVGNSSSNGGGAICTQGTVGGQPGIVTISGTTFSANYSRDGGAIGSSSAVTIEGSTFSSNRGTLQGGAIDNNGGSVSDLTIVNSTFKGNQSATGGAIVSFTALSLTNCTITGNTASGGGGVSVSVGTAEVQNTIIADNSASSRGPDIYGTVTSLGYNLIGDTTDSSGFGAAGDLLDVEPMLDSLADNGGGTKTCALLPGSPAIDAANTATAPETDQRGVARPFGDAADIGAYEFNSGTFSTVSLLPSADGEAGDKTPFDGTFETLDTTSFAFTVHYATSGTAIEQRALLEFNLSAIPATRHGHFRHAHAHEEYQRPYLFRRSPGCLLWLRRQRRNHPGRRHGSRDGTGESDRLRIERHDRPFDRPFVHSIAPGNRQLRRLPLAAGPRQLHIRILRQCGVVLFGSEAHPHDRNRGYPAGSGRDSRIEVGRRRRQRGLGHG